MSANVKEVSGEITERSHEAEIEVAEPVERITVQPKGTDSTPVPSSHGSQQWQHGAVNFTEGEAVVERRKTRFSFIKTRQFWIVLVLSQILSLAVTGTNTITSLLFNRGSSMPAFQTFFNYCLLNLIFTTYTIYKYGFKGWGQLLFKDGWKYFILAFFDVEGNYFTVLAYNYTNLLSAQLINFWAIVVVCVISFFLLKVRYHKLQYLGILICCGGLGMLVASDWIRGANYDITDAVKGDLFALLGASFYGLANVYEEFMVSKRPLYEVLGQLAFWAFFINGTQAAIFDRDSITNAMWDGTTAGYLIGYTLLLSSFYAIAPLVFRMSSAAFFNIGLLTSNFWGLVIATRVFGYSIHYLYPPAFVLIIFGHFVYYGTEGVMGEAKKPWLGENQQEGVSGIGTAKRRIENPDAVV